MNRDKALVFSWTVAGIPIPHGFSARRPDVVRRFRERAAELRRMADMIGIASAAPDLRSLADRWDALAGHEEARAGTKPAAWSRRMGDLASSLRRRARPGGRSSSGRALLT
jgi:hypothetical protein